MTNAWELEPSLREWSAHRKRYTWSDLTLFLIDFRTNRSNNELAHDTSRAVAETDLSDKGSSPELRTPALAILIFNAWGWSRVKTDRSDPDPMVNPSAAKNRMRGWLTLRTAYWYPSVVRSHNQMRRPEHMSNWSLPLTVLHPWHLRRSGVIRMTPEILKPLVNWLFSIDRPKNWSVKRLNVRKLVKSQLK